MTFVLVIFMGNLIIFGVIWYYKLGVIIASTRMLNVRRLVQDLGLRRNRSPLIVTLCPGELDIGEFDFCFSIESIHGSDQITKQFRGLGGIRR